MQYGIEQTLSPDNKDIDFLTKMINEESKQLGIKEEAYPFAFFIKNENGEIIAGCNGSVIFGAIYTDQLWVHPEYRKIGLGKQLMEKVHNFARQAGCKMTTVSTLSFQAALDFYIKLDYKIDFERRGYAYNASCLFLKLDL